MILLIQFLTGPCLATINATYAACGLPSNDASPTMIGIPASFGSLAILFVATRICARLFINKFFGWDDWCIVAAMVMLIESVSKIGRVTNHTSRSLPALWTFSFSPVSCCLFSHESFEQLTKIYVISGREWHGKGYLDNSLWSTQNDAQGKEWQLLIAVMVEASDTWIQRSSISPKFSTWSQNFLPNCPFSLSTSECFLRELSVKSPPVSWSSPLASVYQTLWPWFYNALRCHSCGKDGQARFKAPASTSIFSRGFAPQ